jgi:hypothetical protein
VIGQCCYFQGINSTVEISWDIFRILADFYGRIVSLHGSLTETLHVLLTCLHLVKKISGQSCMLEISIFSLFLQFDYYISVAKRCDHKSVLLVRVICQSLTYNWMNSVVLILNFIHNIFNLSCHRQIQYSYLHSNVIMCIATLLTRWRKR